MAQKASGWIVPLLILGVGSYFGVTKLLPWWQENFGTSGGNPSDCVRLARDADGALESEIRQRVVPPFDIAAWSRFRDEVLADAKKARNACACDTEPCQEARRAISEIRGLVQQIDEVTRSGVAPEIVLDPPLASIEAHLTKAEELERDHH